MREIILKSLLYVTSALVLLDIFVCFRVVAGWL